MTALAAVGALNFISGERGFHRRDALWQVVRAARNAGPLLEKMDSAVAEALREEIPETISQERKVKEIEAIEVTGTVAHKNGLPLLQMSSEERLVADFLGTGMTVGPHPLVYHRAALRAAGVRAAIELPEQ